MKKLFIFLLVLFLLPIVVKADRDLNGEILLYSEQATENSTIVFRITVSCDSNTCDGMLKYDKNMLKYESIDYDFPDMEFYPDDLANINIISNDNGVLKYNFDLNNNEYDNLLNKYTKTTINVRFKIISSSKSNICFS